MGPWLRPVAVVLLVALGLALATPAPADADVMTVIGIATAVVAGVILVVYLIVANVHGSKMGQADAPTLVACVESDAAPSVCWPVARATAPAAVPVQGP